MAKEEVILTNFDKEFFENIPEHTAVLIKESGIYHTITVDGEKAGVVGYIPIFDNEGNQLNFIQIILVSKFRGRGLVRLTEDLLAEKYKLKQLFATISTDNIPSIKAHLKSGFKELDQKILNNLHKNKSLKINQTRLVKNYLSP